ncbi:Crp/Fnr family transcriptional regulator [Sphingomonas panacisoli]|uniref:Crp/Fnr family transcriptional regulator n=1 Tax=Sphingomonas panacisoli TaxID=1813879 RepID=A0A5B8LF17_9SPHN|nr:Crp/Fnr family transcriptional regulator [Sphingomonas panacisoli]QDZ06808.1 Crp/Fnr family transcriptional regulator [Sphingomonas panacisoli]
MLTEDFLRHRRREQLSDEELAALDAIMSPPARIPKRTTIIRAGETTDRSTFLLQGFMCRFLDGANGHRQILSIETSGDFVDLHGYPMKRLDHDIATIGDCEVSYAQHGKLTALIERYPTLGRMLWFSTLVDAAMHREWIFRLGRLDAEGRIAHLICETYARLDAVGLVDNGAFEWPLTQQEIGEACSLTSVHVNRTLRTLREIGLVEIARQRVRVLDLAKLARLAEFTPDYLYLDNHDRTP